MPWESSSIQDSCNKLTFHDPVGWAAAALLPCSPAPLLPRYDLPMQDLRSRRADLILLVVTGALHLVFENVLHRKGAFLAAAAVVWTVWLVRRFREEPDLLRSWGLGSAAFRPAFLLGMAVTLPAAAALWFIGRLLGNMPPPEGFLAVLAVYPLWALIQQVALNGILARGLATWLPRPAVPAAAALLFSLAHTPDLLLMGLTFLGGFIWVSIYLRWPNIWGLVPCHAILGTVAYYAILGRDPWQELLAPLLGHLAGLL